LSNLGSSGFPLLTVFSLAERLPADPLAALNQALIEILPASLFRTGLVSGVKRHGTEARHQKQREDDAPGELADPASVMKT
jgi:hypothetical protein